MSKDSLADLPVQLLLAVPALAFLALGGCSFTPERTGPDVNASVALVQTDQDANTGAVPAQTGHDGNASAVPAQTEPDTNVSAEPQQAADPDFGADAARHALEMVGTPYRYGGKTPKGFDCSGLVVYSYSLAGKQLPVNVGGQRAASRPVPRKQLRPGDLVFFDLADEGRSHVGLYVGGGKFVHAPSRGKVVSTAKLSNPYWRRHFAGARRPALDQRPTRRATSSTSSRPERPLLRQEGI
ncbi:MAG: C40 family peptidase [Burkholderiales bacterium]